MSPNRRRPMLAKGAAVCTMVMASSTVTGFLHLPSQKAFPRVGGLRSLKASADSHPMTLTEKILAKAAGRSL